MAADAVLTFLDEHNRPFSCNEIQSGAKGEFGKTAIQKALDALVEKDKVKEKVYGKQKVYWIIQNKNVSSNELKENLLEMDRKINETSIRLKEITDQIRNYANKMQQVQGKMSLEDTIDKNIKLEKELETVKTELDRFSDVELVCPKIKQEIEKKYEKLLNEYKKRKRICIDAINSIADNYPKGKKALIEDVGIETDESVGFTLTK